MQPQDQLKGLIMQAVQNSALARAQRNSNNPTFHQYYNALIAGNSLNPVINEVMSVVYALTVAYMQGSGDNSLQNAQNVVNYILDGEKHQLGQSHFCYWVTTNIPQNQIPQDTVPVIRQAADNYYNTGVAAGIYQPQQQMGYGQHQPHQRTPSLGNGFQPGFNANNVAGTGLSAHSPNVTQPSTGDGDTQRVSYRARAAVQMGSGGEATVTTPITTNVSQEPTGTPTGGYSMSAPVNQEPPKPPTGDILTWSDYHATRLSERNVVGPDYASARPYDIMLMSGIGGTMNLWVLSHILDIVPDFNIDKPYRRLYSPDVAVRYLVINEKGETKEDFLLLSDHEDAMYAALEQGARPVRRRSSTSDIYRKETAPDTLDPTKIINLDGVEPVSTKQTTPVTQLELSIQKIEETMETTLAKSNGPTAIVDSLLHGELSCDLEHGDSSSCSFMLATPYLGTPIEVELVKRFQDCVTLNDIKLLLDSVGTPKPEERRIYRVITKQLTKNINDVAWDEFRIKMSSVTRDLGDLLAVIQSDFGNDILTEFVRKTRHVIEASTWIMTGDALAVYVDEYMGGGNAIPKGREPLVFCKMMVVNNIGVYSDAIGVVVEEDPVLIDERSTTVSGDASTMFGMLTRVITHAEQEFGNGCVVYLRTLDDHRLRVSRSILQPTSFYVSKFE